MQLAVLDRIAGTQAAAADLGSQLRRLRALDAQLAAIDALGDEDTRSTLQRLVDEVGCTSNSWWCCRPGHMLRIARGLLAENAAQYSRVNGATPPWCRLRVCSLCCAPGAGGGCGGGGGATAAGTAASDGVPPGRRRALQPGSLSTCRCCFTSVAPHEGPLTYQAVQEVNRRYANEKISS